MTGVSTTKAPTGKVTVEHAANSDTTLPQTHRSKVFESKKLSVLNIAEKNKDKIPQYRTILGHGPGTYGYGSLAKNQAPTSSMAGTNQLGMGSAAASGIIFESDERSRSVGIEQKKQALQARNLFVKHFGLYGHQQSN